ncbi:uncharacterized protein LOC144119171 [Amblyomma americanum]
MSIIEENVSKTEDPVSAEAATASSGQRALERTGGLDEYLQQALSLDEEEMKQLWAMAEEGPRTPTNSMIAVEPGSESSAAQLLALGPAARCGTQPQLPQTTAAGGPVATDSACARPTASQRRPSIFNTAPLPTGLVVVLLVGIVAAFAFAIIFRGGRVSGQKQKLFPVLINDTAGISG